MRTILVPALLRIVAAAAMLAALIPGCGPRKVRRAERTLSLFVSGDLGLTDLTRAARLVRAKKANQDCLWVVCGNVLEDRGLTAFSDGDAQVRLLERAGVDALVLGPEWVELGTGRCRELADRARYYSLGANLVDSAGEPLGHPMMVKRYGSEALGLVGAWLDSTDVRLKLRGVRAISADFAVRKNVPLVLRRAGIAGAAIRPAGPVPDWNVDLVVGTDTKDAISVAPGSGSSVSCLELRIRGDAIRGFRVVEHSLTDVEPDSSCQAALDSIVAACGSVGAEPVVTLGRTVSASELTGSLAESYVKSGRADGFMLDRPLLQRSLGQGVLSRQALVEALEEPGRIALVRLSRSEVDSLLADSAVSVRWRKGLDKAKGSEPFRVAATLGFLKRHRSAAKNGFELDDRQFWAVASEILSRTQEAW